MCVCVCKNENVSIRNVSYRILWCNVGVGRLQSGARVPFYICWKKTTFQRCVCVCVNRAVMKTRKNRLKGWMMADIDILYCGDSFLSRVVSIYSFSFLILLLPSPPPFFSWEEERDYIS